jgi:hypothetical protein
MNTMRRSFTSATDHATSQIFHEHILAELERKSLRYLGHKFRNDFEIDLAFSKTQSGPVPKPTLRLTSFPKESKKRLARLWLSDQDGHP